MATLFWYTIFVVDVEFIVPKCEWTAIRSHEVNHGKLAYYTAILAIVSIAFLYRIHSLCILNTCVDRQWHEGTKCQRQNCVLACIAYDAFMENVQCPLSIAYLVWISRISRAYHMHTHTCSKCSYMRSIAIGKCHGILRNAIAAVSTIADNI